MTLNVKKYSFIFAIMLLPLISGCNSCNKTKKFGIAGITCKEGISDEEWYGITNRLNGVIIENNKIIWSEDSVTPFTRKDSYVKFTLDGKEWALPYRQEFSFERDMYTIFVDGELLKEIQVVEIEQE